jgi:hypothetical protein
MCLTMSSYYVICVVVTHADDPIQEKFFCYSFRCQNVLTFAVDTASIKVLPADTAFQNKMQFVKLK